MMRTSELTRTDQKFLSRARSSRWNCKLGPRGIDLQIEGRRLDRFLFVTLLSLPRLSVKVSAMRKFMRAVVSGQWSVVSGQWSVVSGQWSVVGGRWLVVGGQWLVVGGQWLVVGGQWLVVGGQWLVVGGRWSVVGGRWSVVSG